METAFMRIVLLSGHALSLISLLLSSGKSLCWASPALFVVASLMARTEPHQAAYAQSLHFGRDYFIVNVLIVGCLFVTLEPFFPARVEQNVLRAEWQADMFCDLVSSMLVQILGLIILASANHMNAQIQLDDVRTYVTICPLAPK